MSNQTDELTLINKYSRKELTPDEVYVFSVTLCDNEIDRDFERFTKQALEELGPLFEGKTGIFDHNMRSSGQTARIFKTWVETDPVKKTSLGEPYSRLCARAYMIRTEQNKALIDEIEGGIKKEVSVGCSMDKITCSVCGGDMKTHRCEHIKGKTYGTKLCFGILSKPTDAYEWSFVAVPAQRAAGVTKSFLKEESMDNAVDIIKSSGGETVLTKSQTAQLRDYIVSLEAQAQDAKEYRQQITDQVRKYALIAMPKVDVKEFLLGCENMTTKQLNSLKNGLKAQSEQLFPPEVQLKPTAQTKAENNNAFKI